MSNVDRRLLLTFFACSHKKKKLRYCISFRWVRLGLPGDAKFLVSTPTAPKRSNGFSDVVLS